MATAYTEYLPSGTNLLSGDYLTSPSGTFFATIGTSNTDGKTNLILSGGSNPTLNPGPGAGVLSANTAFPNANDGGFFVSVQAIDGNVVLYTNTTGNPSDFPITPTRSSGTIGFGETFVKLADSGILSIVQGTPANPGISIFETIVAGELQSIQLTGQPNYDFSKATFTSTKSIGILTSTNLDNTTPVTQVFPAFVNQSYTQTNAFSFSVGKTTSETISSSVSVGVPGIGQTSVGFSITDSTTVTKGQADSTSVTVGYKVGAQVNVPAFSTYGVIVTATQASYKIPFTWTGIGTYALPGTGLSYTANVVGTGIFEGASTGNFSAEVFCVIAVAPQPCDPGNFSVPVDVTVLVAEPASTMVFAAALLGATVLRRRRGARRQV